MKTSNLGKKLHGFTRKVVLEAFSSASLARKNLWKIFEILNAKIVKKKFFFQIFKSFC